MRTRIARMLRFAGKWKVWLECGHTLQCSREDAAQNQLFIGKPITCTQCQEKP